MDLHAEDKIYELADLKSHSREDDCWLVIDGEVYDVTTFLDEHPGGFDIILASTGDLALPYGSRLYTSS